MARQNGTNAQLLDSTASHEQSTVATRTGLDHGPAGRTGRPTARPPASSPVPETGFEPASLTTAGFKPTVSTRFHHSGPYAATLAGISERWSPQVPALGPFTSKNIEVSGSRHNEVHFACGSGGSDEREDFHCPTSGLACQYTRFRRRRQRGRWRVPLTLRHWGCRRAAANLSHLYYGPTFTLSGDDNTSHTCHN